MGDRLLTSLKLVQFDHLIENVAEEAYKQIMSITSDLHTQTDEEKYVDQSQFNCILIPTSTRSHLITTTIAENDRFFNTSTQPNNASNASISFFNGATKPPPSLNANAS